MKRPPPADPPGTRPVRKIGKNYWSMTGTLVSDKSDGGAEFESTLERDYYICLELIPEVARVVPQPVQLTYQHPNGRTYPYTPDSLVHYHDGRRPALVEVKYVQDILKERELYICKFRAARAYARGQGWTFMLVTDRVIRTPFLENARRLRPYLRRDVPAATEEELLSALAAMTYATPRELLACFAPERRGELLPVLWKLVATRRVTADLSVPFSMNSRIGIRGPA